MLLLRFSLNLGVKVGNYGKGEKKALEDFFFFASAPLQLKDIQKIS